MTAVLARCRCAVPFPSQLAAGSQRGARHLLGTIGGSGGRAPLSSSRSPGLGTLPATCRLPQELAKSDTLGPPAPRTNTG